MKYTNVAHFMRLHPELPPELAFFFEVALKYDSVIGFASRHALLDSLSPIEIKEITDTFTKLSDIKDIPHIGKFLNSYFDSNTSEIKYKPDGSCTDAYICATAFVELYSSIMMRSAGEYV